MIFLDQVVRQILREEGQLVVSLDDLMITMDDLEQLFIDTYEQAKAYVSIYNWTEVEGRTDPQNYPGFSHIKHITYNAYNNMQRFMPDVPGNYYEFNPYYKKFYSLMATNFSGEVGEYAKCEHLKVNRVLGEVKKNNKFKFILPATFDPDTFQIKSINDKTITAKQQCDEHIDFSGTLGSGRFNTKTLKGEITFKSDDIGVNMDWTSKYVGINELDLSNAEIFYVWYKANVLTMIGSIKEQTDLTGAQMPFDLNRDGLLQRGRDLLAHVEDLKINKSHWSNF